MSATGQRFRLNRAGVLNVWQYDEQVFEFAGGRMLLRGANGAGKSKTLEMLLPFVLDGDKNRMTASGKHHTSLLWLMTDGYEGQSRTGYLWVEFARDVPGGSVETLTCGVGVRASQSARSATCWYFTTPNRIGPDLPLEDEAGPLSKERCREAIGPAGHFFDSPRQYKEHVGHTLFGLPVDRFDELLRLLYWLRQPQVGEEIEPARLAGILSVALPELEEASLRSAGDTFDELAAFGEQIERRQQAATAMSAFAEVYAGYARSVAQTRGAALAEADREQRHRAAELAGAERDVAQITTALAAAEAAAAEVEGRRAVAEARLQQLETGPEAQSKQRLLELARAATLAGDHAGRADQQVSRAQDRLASTGSRLSRTAAELTDQLRRVGADAQQALTGGRRIGLRLEVGLPARLSAPVLAETADADLLRGAVAEFSAGVRRSRPAIGERLAAVTAVDAARQESAEADRVAAEADRVAARAEHQAEQAHGRRADAAAAAAGEESAFLAQLAGWRSAAAAVPLDLPADLDATSVSTLPGLARQAAEPRLVALRGAEAMAAANRVAAQRETDLLHDLREQIAAEREPAPAAPSLARSPRDQLPGAPLWRLTEFAPSCPAPEAAGVEAALESAGLLDAWVRPDGAVLDADRLDVVLAAAPGPAPAAGPEPGTGPGPRTEWAQAPPDSSRILVPASGELGGVTADVVTAVLSQIALIPPGHAPPEPALAAGVSTDGRWWLGPLAGRAAKAVAQYIGATARAAERGRRLAEVDAQLQDSTERTAAATAAEAAARAGVAGIETWLAALPAGSNLLRRWALLDAAQDEALRADGAARATRAIAQASRSDAAGHRADLQRLADRLDLPVDADGLAARRQELHALDNRLERCDHSLTSQLSALRSWQSDRQELDTDRELLDELRTVAAELRSQADVAQTASDTEQEKVGASVEALQARVQDAYREIDSCKRQSSQLAQELRALSERHGAARTRVETARARREEHDPIVVERARMLAALAEVPGLLVACRLEAASYSTPIELARALEPGSRVPAEVARFIEVLGALEGDHRAIDDTAVWKGHQELAAGHAADTEPRILPIGGALAALARDDTGEHPVGVLAARLNAQVARDKELLTDRERRLFEDHILGDLGETLRSRRIEAVELVAAMNRLLAGISTSQGIRVSLDWRLREDVTEDAQRAVTLLGQPLGALLPDERRDLRDCLHRLIEASRAEDPELSYTEHLMRCLDYRQWFAFRIRYTRPETPGKWQDLHRRSALSQGEQKVICYLPLFAAAAAHFTSVAGAAPHAPRFVLLDDAFPKIDMRTHPLLFGLLVDLDLDFVVTSERLWGDHATVPSLAIYEALRDPAQRGIAQYRHTWDGQRLRAVGA